MEGNTGFVGVQTLLLMQVVSQTLFVESLQTSMWMLAASQWSALMQLEMTGHALVDALV
jgi:hypothetical protein